MRAKLLTAIAAGLALLALPVLAQAPPPDGPRHHRPGPPPRAEAEQPRLSPAVHIRRGDLMLDLDCSIRDTIEDCTEAALRLIDRLESPPPRP